MYSFITEAAIERNISNIYVIIIVSVMIVIFMAVFCSIEDYFKRLISINASKKLRDEVMKKVLTLDFLEFNSENTSHYASILLNDVEIIEDNYFSKILDILGEILQFIVMLLFIALIDLRLAGLVLLFCIPLIFQPFILKSKLTKVGLEVSQNLNVYTDRSTEYVDNVEIIKMHNRGCIFSNNFSSTASILEKTRKKQFFLNALNVTILVLVIYALKIAFATLFVANAISGVVTVAAALTLFGFANQVANPLWCFVEYKMDIFATKEVRKKITGFLSPLAQKMPAIPANTKTVDMKTVDAQFKHSIRFENVSFTYPEQTSPVLKNVNISFLPGKKYLIIGESGSGKSTIFRLLMGYYPDYQGKILFDDFDLKNLDVKSIRNKISIITQDIFVFSGSLRDNITLYNEQFSSEQLDYAIEKASLESVVSALPEGLNTLIEENGGNFSGGEKQRIAIARAILADRDILMIDEASSSLDKTTAEEIERNFLSLNKTLISISHQIHTAASDYDEVIEISNGQVVKQGDIE